MQDHKKWLDQILPDVGNYIAGFVDGEGSFNISLRRREDHKLKWDIDPSFNVSQKDRVILAFLKKEFGCGTLRERKDGVVYFEVRNLSMLYDRVIPFFDKFGFRSAAKKRNFAIFKSIINILRHESSSKEVLEKVVQLREILNIGHGRKRKYEAHHVLLNGKSSETLRQTRPLINTVLVGNEMIKSDLMSDHEPRITHEVPIISE
ncbi:MAG: LAGLIDADG family homing endonuclease [Patescibacteria group bacterium]